MQKSVFKKEYSLYRKALNQSFYKGKEAYLLALKSNHFFRDILLSKSLNKPVSLKIWLYINS